MSCLPTRKTPDLSRYAPPGFDVLAMTTALLFLLFLSAVSGCLIFVRRLHESLVDLRHLQAQEDRVMADFHLVAEGAATPFLASALVMALSVLLLWGHFRRGSRSVYLMRRLPHRWEYLRRTLPLPLAGAVICLLAIFPFTLFCFAVYLNMTPGQYLPPGLWSSFWRSFL